MIAALAVSAAPAQATKHRDACHPRGAKTAAQKGKTRVFWVGDRLYACRSGGTRALFLGELLARCPGPGTSGCDDVTDIRVAGRFVAVVWYVETRESSTSTVDLVDVASRKQVQSWSIGGGRYDFAWIAGIKLSSRGAVGLIATLIHAEAGYPRVHEVRTLSAKRVDLLDSGEDIDDQSLALSRNGTLYWTHGDTVRSAPLQ